MTGMAVDIVFEYFPALSNLQKDQLRQLDSLYKNWNEKINVISRKDIEELYLKHVLHSLGIAKVINFQENTQILDVGTGGGFPGIPLAILFPKCHFHLVDSIGKKIKVVNEVKNALALNNVVAEQVRAEQVDNKYHFIISRAVTQMKPFYQWVKDKVENRSFNEVHNGLLCLKGGDLREELKESGLSYQSFSLIDFFKPPFFETKKVIYVPVKR